MSWKTLSSWTPWPGPVEAISSRFGSGAMFATSSSASRRAGSIGSPVLADFANAPAVMSASSATNSPRSRRWSSAGAIR